MALRTNPLVLFTMWRSGLDLLRTGRLKLLSEKLKHVPFLPKEDA
jgi:hypothetical protein